MFGRLVHSDPRVVVPATAVVGEGPLWDDDGGLLHWVDIPAGRIHSSDVVTGTTRTLQLPWSVGAIGRMVGGGLVFASEAGFGVADDNATRLELEYRRPGERMNDAKVDPAGRLWAGSTAMDFGAGRGRVHVVDGDWKHDVVLTGLTLPNGMDWSADATTYYLVDTYQHVLYAFEYAIDDGVLQGQRVLTSFPEEWGLPDGLTVDANGGLWLALWGGSRVLSISPDGEVLGSIELPVRQPSSCAFGGEGYRTLFITTARDGIDVAADAPDGSVLAVEIDGVHGRAPFTFGGSE